MIRLAKSHRSRINTASLTTYRRYIILLAFVVSFLFLSSVKVIASNLGEEFTTNNSFSTGVVVSLDQDNPESIEFSSLSNSEYLLGVVTEKGSNTVTYAKDESQVTVSLTGEVIVYVNDANGPIQAGDFIGASWLEGVGMKAITQDRQKLVGVALEDFNEEEADQYGEIDTSEGKKDVSIDAIRVRLFDKEGSNNLSDADRGVESILENIAGKSVSSTRLLVVSLIFVFAVVLSGFFIASSIKGSFVSIGRNPLASDSIYRSLSHVTLVSIAIILIGTFLSYIVLVI